jgi:hypothetical protein
VSLDSSADIAIGYRLDSQGFIPGRAKRFSLLHIIQTVALVPIQSKVDRVVKLAPYIHLVPRSGMMELYFHSPISLDGIVLN